ncbi:metallophosphoesterase family protein [Verrucomicrobiota bacterium sgz303538]
MRFIHSADWQIGARFRQFREKAAWLREVRLRTLGRALALASERNADAFLIAGDLFEDNQVEPDVLTRVWKLLADFSEVPVFILPGNHDPSSGPGSIWARRPFASPPEHVKIFTAPEAVELKGNWLVANPLTQKRSTVDPSRKLAELARDLPSEAIKVGLTHGSLAIESRHEPDDFPIALDAATRAGLDYLAIGHWHSEQRFDGDRLVMAGTPEQTDFGEHSAGCVQEVEISDPGERPTITSHRVGELTWQHWQCEITDANSARSRIEQLTGNLPELSRVILRITLQGSAPPSEITELLDSLHARFKGCPILEVCDETLPEFTSAELAVLQAEHPLIGQVLDDLQALTLYAQGQGGIAPTEATPLCSRVGCTPADLTPQLVATARRMLLRDLREVQPSC